MSSSRNLSLPQRVAEAGGIEAWNLKHPELTTLDHMLDGMCKATTVEEATNEVKSVMSIGHNLWAYMYMRKLYNKNMDLYYSLLLSDPSGLLPVVYTPTVGEACQKFGKIPQYPRGCIVASKDRGNLKKVLQEYAEAMLEKDAEGNFLCDCIVFSDGGRILGLGDLGIWGMGIPIGKLDLYTVCAGINPHRTVPVMIDAGITDAAGNTDKITVRDSPLYGGQIKNRELKQSAAKTMVNSMYYGETNMIEEFMTAATEVFGKGVLLQFEDFNSNDAFPLLAEYRNKFVSYNDDIQGTASVCVAACLGAIKLQKPTCKSLRAELLKQTFLFHGAGSANIGAMRVLEKMGVPKSQIFVTNSRGIIWKSEDGSDGSFRNDDQKEYAVVGKPTAYNSGNLVEAIKALKPQCLVGAVGVAPNCFTKQVVEAMVEVTKPSRPVIFAMSNPTAQAEINSTDCYKWSGGAAIYGSGTKMPSVEVDGKLRTPGQVNNVYIFPGVSMGAVCCKATSIPEELFIVAAEAVADSLNTSDMEADRVVPHTDNVRHVGLMVATAVVMECQRLGIATVKLGDTAEEVEHAVERLMWVPEVASTQHAVKEGMAKMRASQRNRNAPGIQEAAENIAKALPIDSDVDARLADTKNPVRAIKVVLDTKRPRFIEASTVLMGDSLDGDLAGVKQVLAGDQACGVLVRVDDKAGSVIGATENDYVMIVCVPAGAPQRIEKSWLGAGASFIQHYPNLRIAEMRISAPDEVTLTAVKGAAGSVIKARLAP